MDESTRHYGEFHIVHTRAGRKIGEWRARNRVVNVGLDMLVDGCFGTAPSANVDYVGLGSNTGNTATV